MVHNMQFEAAEEIADNLLNTNIRDADRGRALLVKARTQERADNLDSATAIGLSALKLAEAEGLVDVAAGANITLSLIHERVGNFDISVNHLDQAEQLLFDHQLEGQYAQYYVRRASLNRLIFDRANASINALAKAQADFKELAELAEKYALKYDQLWHRADAQLLLGSLYGTENSVALVYHRKTAIKLFKEAKEYISAGYMYLSLASHYLELDSQKLAWSNYDSAASIMLLTRSLPSGFYQVRAELFAHSGQYDSAFACLQKQHQVYTSDINEQNRAEIARLNAVHDNVQKQTKILAQDRENAEQKKVINRTVALLVAVLLILVLLFFGYRRKRAQNDKITEQRGELEQALHRQKVLLAEVQHRVKNNLQVIIAMLDMQSEAIGYKSIEEITQENQRRIESMAFLHDKVYLSEDLEHVKLQSYLDQIADLLHGTYASKDISVDIAIQSEIDSVPVDKAIPLGLITVELLMNSFKHAFEGRAKGSIRISTIKTSESPNASKLVYQDDGHGYETTPKSSGLGTEIIKGLAGQLHGNVEMDGSDGFRAIIKF